VKKVLLVVAALSALAFAGPAAADQTYADATGENAAAADISGITVSNSPAAGTITMKVTLANRPNLDDGSSLLVFLDTDRNSATGSTSGGFEYLFGLDSGGYQWLKWDGTQFGDAGVQLPVTFTGGIATFTVNAADIGSVGSFDFAVVTFSGPDPNNPITDVAPEDGQPLFTYTLATIQIVPTSVAAVPSGLARAGKPFSIKALTVNLSNGTQARATAVSCTATLGGLKLRGTGAGGCTFKLPAKSKGKKLVVNAKGKYNALTVVKQTVVRVG
jgi:hypothetical protein